MEVDHIMSTNFVWHFFCMFTVTNLTMQIFEVRMTFMMKSRVD